MENNIFLYVIAPLVTGFATWVYSRRKYRAEARSAEIESDKSLSDYYRDEIQSLTERIRLYREENRQHELLYFERETEHLKSIREANEKIDKLMLWFCCRQHCRDRVSEDGHKISLH